MATTKEDLLIEIKANTTQATAGFNKVVASLGNLERQLQVAAESQRRAAKGLNDFGATAAKIAATFYVAQKALGALTVGLQKTVGEFFRSEDATKRLANALRLTGEQDIQGSVRRFRELADQLARTTTIEDDQVTALAALGVAAGRSDNEIVKLIKTSVDFAAATDQDVTSSMQTLLGTFKGQTRALEVYAPQLKNLTQQQILSGEAIDVLARKFDGFGSALATTFSGRMQRAKNTFGNIMEEIGKVIAAGFNIDQASTNLLNLLDDIADRLSVNGAAITGIIAEIKQSFSNFLDFLTMGLGLVSTTILKITDLLSTKSPILSFFNIPQDEVKSFEKQIDSLMGGVGKIFDSMKSPSLAAEEAIDRYRKGAEDVVKANDKAKRALPVKVVSEESIQLLKELASKSKDLQQQAQLANQTEIDQIHIKAAQEREALAVMEKKLRAEGALNAAARNNLALGREAISIAEQAEVDKKRLTTLTEITDQNRSISQDIERQGMIQYDIINQRLQEELRVLDVKREQLKLNEEENAVALKALDAQEKLLKEKASKEQARGPSQEFQQTEKLGKDLGTGITQAFQSGPMASMMGMMSGAASAIGAAQGVVDGLQSLVNALPNLLNSIGDLFNSIVDLPLKLAQGIEKILGAVLNLIRNFIPNIIKMVASILESVVSFVEKLPEEFMAMIDDLDQLIKNLIESLPALAERLITALIVMTPEIMLKAIEFLFFKLPELAVRLAKVLLIRMPLAIYDGFVKGLIAVRDMFTNLFKGKWPKAKTPKIEIDDKKVKKSLAKLTQDTNKMFNVRGLEDPAGFAKMQTAKNEADKVINAAKKAGYNMWESFKTAMSDGWHWFMDQGKRIWDGVVQAVGQAWNFIGTWGAKIWHGLLDAIGDIAKVFGEWGSAIWHGLLNVIGDIAKVFGEWGAAIWSGLLNVLGDVAEVFGNWGAAIWSGLLNVIGDIAEVFGKWGAAIWSGLLNVLGDVAEVFGKWGAAIWSGLLNVIGDIAKVFGGWGAAIWSGLLNALGNIGKVFGGWGASIWSGLLNALGNIGKVFGGWGASIWGGLVGAIGQAGSIFAQLGTKMWEGLISGIQNGGSILSKIFQFDGGGKGTVEKFIGMDFPFVAFSRGGLVPGASKYPGDAAGNDTVPALLSPGEIVLPRSVLGDEAFRRIVMMKLSGQEIPTFAAGGIIGTLKDAGGSISDGVKGAISQVTDAVLPGWLKDIWQSLSRFVPNIDFSRLIANPSGEILEALKSTINGSMMPFIKQVLTAPTGFAQGGLVEGPGGTDTVPAWLTAGEFVVNRQAVREIGLPALQALNGGRSAIGGNTTQHITLNLKIETKERIDDNFVKQRLMPAIRDELRRGSLDGRAVVYAGGVRA